MLHHTGCSTISTLSRQSPTSGLSTARASQNFEDLASASYDSTYCRQATSNYSLDWEELAAGISLLLSRKATLVQGQLAQVQGQLAQVQGLTMVKIESMSINIVS